MHILILIIQKKLIIFWIYGPWYDVKLLLLLQVRPGHDIKLSVAPVAQWLRRVTSNHEIAGSNPAGGLL